MEWSLKITFSCLGGGVVGQKSCRRYGNSDSDWNRHLPRKRVWLPGGRGGHTDKVVKG